MSLNAALNLWLDSYSRAARAEPFGSSAMAEFVRKEIPAALQGIVGSDERYLPVGSAGKGNWARIPWVAVFDRLVTETAQDGIYLVYLYREDGAGIYLSLNQGVTTVRRAYGADAKEALRVRAADYAARLGSLESATAGPIDLAATSASSLGAFYEQGSIASQYYERGRIPSDEVLASDLRALLLLYKRLADKELSAPTTTVADDDEADLGEEDLTNLREHKRIERNRTLARAAKRIHGSSCQACGFDFEAYYGALGKGYIEAHHLMPLHTLKGQRVTLDPRKDFVVLCSNCHRMIHRSGLVDRVETFRKNHIKAPNR